MSAHPECAHQQCGGACLYNSDDDPDGRCLDDEVLQSYDSFLDSMLDCDALVPMDVEAASSSPLRGA